MDSIEPILPSRPEPATVAASARIAPARRDARGGDPGTPGRRGRGAREHADEEAVTVAVEGVVEPSSPAHDRPGAPGERPRVDLSA